MDGQSEAVERLLGFENGILSAPTGFGKTVIGAAVIARLKMPTLVIVPKTALVPQWKERLSEFSGRALQACGCPIWRRVRRIPKCWRSFARTTREMLWSLRTFMKP